jgi:hypothetical protein
MRGVRPVTVAEQEGRREDETIDRRGAEREVVEAEAIEFIAQADRLSS